MLGLIIGISVVKPDVDKVGCWLERTIVTVINTELGNCEFFSLYLALTPILLCELGVHECVLGMGLKWSVITDVLVAFFQFLDRRG